MLTTCTHQTRSGRDFSKPYEAITPTAPGYSYGALLSGAIERSTEDDVSDYGDDASGSCGEDACDSDYDDSLASGGGSDDERVRTSDCDGDSTAPVADVPHPRLFITIPPRPRPRPALPLHVALMPGKPKLTPHVAANAAPHTVTNAPPSVAPAPSAPKRKRRKSAHAAQAMKLRSKRTRVANRLQQAACHFARPKRALQARSVRGSSPLAAPFKIAEKRVAKTAYVGLRDPKPTPTADPASDSDGAHGSYDSTGEFDSDGGVDSDCEAASDDEPADSGREARAYTAEEMDARGFGYVRWGGK